MPSPGGYGGGWAGDGPFTRMMQESPMAHGKPPAGSPSQGQADNASPLKDQRVIDRLTEAGERPEFVGEFKDGHALYQWQGTEDTLLNHLSHFLSQRPQS